MKKILSSLFFISTTVAAFGQAVTSVPAEYNDPTSEVKILINLDQLDQSKDYVLNLIADADAGLDLYMWTWKPFEFPIGSPKANGEGGAPWKNSNELLKLTKEANHLYSYTMIPTQFYEVDAATVFKEDIQFLVKPKDGGGYGDPDRKSDDLKLEVNPPNVERSIVYGFPMKVQEDDLLTITYDNYKETKTSMQQLNPDEVYLYLEATLTDSTVLKPSGFFQVGNNPELKLTETATGSGSYAKTFIPRLFFNLNENQHILSLKAVAMKKVFQTGADRVDQDYILKFGCK